MFTLFALLKDPSGAVTNDALIRDIRQKFHWAREYEISTEDLFLPRVTEVVLQKGGWKVSFQIRDAENMSLGVPEVQKILGGKTGLPEDFLDYDTEIAIGFGDDPDRLFTNDIIEIGEFVQKNYPGVVIFDPGSQDIW